MNSSSRDPVRQYTFVGRRRKATGRSNGNSKSSVGG